MADRGDVGTMDRPFVVSSRFGRRSPTGGGASACSEHREKIVPALTCRPRMSLAAGLAVPSIDSVLGHIGVDVRGVPSTAYLASSTT